MNVISKSGTTLETAVAGSQAGEYRPRGYAYRILVQLKDVEKLSLDEIRLETSFLGKPLQLPLLISSMTGGTEQALQINRTLAEAAEALGCGLLQVPEAVERLAGVSESPRLDAEILLCRTIDMPRSYLFADEVGLGKTIEVGLVLRELLLSGRAERALLLQTLQDERQLILATIREEREAALEQVGQLALDVADPLLAEGQETGYLFDLEVLARAGRKEGLGQAAVVDHEALERFCDGERRGQVQGVGCPQRFLREGAPGALAHARCDLHEDPPGARSPQQSPQPLHFSTST